MTVALPRFGTVAPVRRPTTVPDAAARSSVNPLVRWTFYLFVLSIPFEMPHRTIPLEIPTLTGFAFLASTLLNPTACFRRIPAALVWFGVYLWVLALSTVVNVSDHPQMVLRLSVSMIQLVLIFWVGANLLADPRVRRGVLLALVVACAVRAGLQVTGVAATSHAVWTGGERVTALGQNANLSAIILSAGLITVIGLHLGALAWPLGLLMGLAIIQTGSRGGLLCAAVGLLAFLWQGRTPWIRLRTAALGFAAIGLLSWGAYRSDMMRSRFEQAAEEGQLAGRERIYPALLEMFGERPLLGWGPIDNQYEIARRIDERQKIRRDAHNLVLELLTTAGALGAFPFLIGLALCLRAAWRARHGPAGILPLALVGTVLMGTVSGTWIASKILWLALAHTLASDGPVGPLPAPPPCAV